MNFPTYTSGDRPALAIADARLHNIFVHRPELCASIDEYAQSAGMPIDDVIRLLSPWLENSTLSLEIWGDQMFVHTAPLGRPTPANVPDVPPNMWERLRSGASAEVAHDLWDMARSMERAGWVLEVNPNRVAFGLAASAHVPPFAVVVGRSLVGVVPFRSPAELATTSGPLTNYDLAGAAAVAVPCPAGKLDEYVTAVRVWVGQRQLPAAMSVLVLEAPRWNPTILTPRDASVVPVSVSREALIAQGIPERSLG